MSRGGKREGAGAKKKSEPLKTFSIRLSETDLIKLKLLGGAKWIRKIISTYSK
jgi:hypothetical protein